jgi:cell division protein FtsQ
VSAPTSPTRPPGAASRLPIDPRIRQRRIEVKRSEGRRRLRLLASAAGVVLVGAAGWGVLRSPLLAVRRVIVVGAVHTAPADAERAAGLTHDRQMADLDLGAMDRAVDALPWVATARVIRHWPDHVTISITERRPVAAAADARAGWALLDRSGRVLALTPTVPAGLVTVAVVTSPPGATPASPLPPAGDPGTTVDQAVLPALQVVGAMPSELSGRVAGVVVTTAGDLRLELVGGAQADLGSAGDLTDKFTAVVTVLDKVPVGTGIIDVQVPTAPVLQSLTGPSPGR